MPIQETSNGSEIEDRMALIREHMLQSKSKGSYSITISKAVDSHEKDENLKASSSASRSGPASGSKPNYMVHQFVGAMLATPDKSHCCHI